MAKKQQTPQTDAPKKRHGSVQGAREMVKLLTIHAQQGHPGSVASIEKWLEVFPELRPESQALVELAERTEAAWATAVSLGDPLAEQVARGESAKLKAELMGDAPSQLDRVMASVVVVAHLAHSRAAIMAAQRTEHIGVREYRERILSATQKRLVSAIKAHTLITRKKKKGMRPKQKLKLFEPFTA